jgi:hypothetical protein
MTNATANPKISEVVAALEARGSHTLATILLDELDDDAAQAASESADLDYAAARLLRELEAARVMAVEALDIVKRGAREADYYCPDDVADDHEVLVSFTVGDLPSAATTHAALEKIASPSTETGT